MPENLWFCRRFSREKKQMPENLWFCRRFSRESRRAGKAVKKPVISGLNLEIWQAWQHGFREQISCETQLIQLIDELARGFSSGRQTDLVLIDFSKAFDKVSHTKLLFKLHQHGITQNNHSWIKAFLLRRSQCVTLEGEKSSEIPVTSGVPQAPRFGPWTNLVPPVRKWPAWTHKFTGQTFCQVLHITRGPESPPNPVCSTWPSSGGSRPCKVPWTGNLSRPELEPTNVTPKANRTLGFVRRNIQTKHKAIRQAALNTIVRPQVEYASPVWCPYTKTIINKIEAVHRRAARWFTNNHSSYSSVTQMINTLGWRS